MTATILTLIATIITFVIRWWWVREEKSNKEDEIHAADAKILKRQRDNNVTDVDSAKLLYKQLQSKFNK